MVGMKSLAMQQVPMEFFACVESYFVWKTNGSFWINVLLIFFLRIQAFGNSEVESWVKDNHKIEIQETNRREIYLVKSKNEGKHI